MLRLAHNFRQLGDGARRHLHSGKELRQMSGHSTYVIGMGISADGRVLATGSHDGTVRLWGAK